MALFKILKGEKERLPSSSKEGWIYITEDSKDMYIFVSDSERIQLNANSANTLRNDDNSLLSIGTISNPVYFSNGKPVACTSVHAATAEAADEATLAGTASRLSNTAAVGSSTKPVYFSADGIPVAGSTYAGGTRVTLNGTSKKSSSASFYAPTGSGTEGQVLISAGTGAPVWADTSTLDVNSAVTANSAGTAATLGAATIGGSFEPIYLDSGTPKAGTAYGEAIKSITRNGTTFTFTRLDGSTGTFTQQDSNTEYSAGTGIAISNKVITNTGVRSITTGSANGTISVNTNGTSADVAVKGLGNAAFQDMPTALKNPTSLTVKYGTTTSFTYDGSTAKTLSIKAGNNISVTGDTSGNITITAAYSNATTGAAGLMSATDKAKLDGIATGANKYTLPVATTTALGGIKSGTDITVDSNGNVSIKDDSHNHIIDNIDGLQQILDNTQPKGNYVTTDNSGVQSIIGGLILGGTAATAAAKGRLMITGHTNPLIGLQAIDADGNQLTPYYFQVANDIMYLGPTSSKALAFDRDGNVSLPGTLTVTGAITGNLNGNATTATTATTAGKVAHKLTIRDKVYDGSADVTVDAEIFYVTITDDGSGDYSANKTFSDIITAYNNGQVPVAILEQEMYSFISASRSAVPALNAIKFGKFDGTTYKLLTIGQNTVTIKTITLAAIEDLPEVNQTPFYLIPLLDDNGITGTIQGGLDGFIGDLDAIPIEDPTEAIEQCYNAYLSGRACFMVIEADSSGVSALPLIYASENLEFYFGISLGPIAIIGQVYGENVVIEEWEMPEKLPNPESLTIGSKTYDGSSAVSIGITDFGAASSSSAGYMSAADKSKLDGITASADAVSFSRELSTGTKIGTITINGTGTDLYAPTNTNTTYSLSGKASGNTWVTTLTPSSGSATTSTVPAVTTSSAGLMLAADKTKLNGISTGATKTSYSSGLSSGVEVGTITIDGTATKLYAPNVTAESLGLSSAMKFLGVTTTALSQGATTNPITIDSKSVTATAGNVVLYSDAEYVWTGSKWERLGLNSSFKVVQTAVSSPSTNGETTEFIDSISQNTQGVITATKKKVTFPTYSFVNKAATLAWNTAVTIASIGGTDITVKLPANPNSDTKVTQTLTSENKTYPLLLAPTGQTATATTTSYFDSGVTLNPSTNTITANITGNAATATTSTTAGKVANKLTIGGKTYDGSGAVSISITDFGAASSTTGGYMSATDKAKLDGITESADAVSISRSLTSGTKIGTITINGTGTDLYAPSLANTANKDEGTFFINGTGTTDSTAKTSAWTGTNNRITSLYDGLTIRYKIGVEGQSTVTLNINGLGAKTVYRFGTSKLTTHFPVGSIIHLTYHEDLNDGCWMCNDYDANTNTQQRVYVTTTNKEYPITTRYNTTTGSSYYAEYGRYSTGVTLNPSTNTITATKFKGALEGNAATATTATSAGKVANKLTIAGKTYDGSSAVSVAITDFGAASTTAAGYMSAADKEKLDGITTSADSVSISRSLTSGTKIGTITINGTGTDLYAPTNTNTTYSLSGAANGNTWVTTLTPSSGNATTSVVPAASTSAAGLMTAAMVTKLNSITDNADAVSFSSNLSSGTKIGTITINGTGTDLYCQTNTNTTYSLSGAASGNTWVTTLTPSSGSATTSTIPAATSSAAGLMTSAMVTKLSNITESADAVSFTQSLTEGTKIGTITINGTATDLYCQTNTNTTYGADRGISLVSGKFGHSNTAITAGSVGSAQSPSHGGTFAIPKITYDAYGHITGATTVNITLPADNNVTQNSSSANSNLPLLLAYQASPTSGTASTANYATSIYANPSTNSIGATNFLQNSLDLKRIYCSMIPYGTEVPADADLNTITYLKVGNYYCSKNTTVATLANCPTSSAFMMQVYTPLSTTIDNETTKGWVYRLRKMLVYTGHEYIQYIYSGATAGTFTYGPWRLIIKESDTATASTAGVVKVSSVNTTAVTVNSETTTSGRYYPIEMNSDGKLIVNVPWVNNTYTVNDAKITLSAGAGLTGGGDFTLNQSGAETISFAHSNSVTAKTTYNQNTDSPGYGGTFKITEPKYDAQGHITGVQVATITMPSAQTIPTSLKNPNALTIGAKTYDGSAAIIVAASDLGLTGAMVYKGSSSTAITDGGTQAPTIGGSSIATSTLQSGNVVLYGNQEFVWNGSKWELLGDEGSYKVKQDAVSSPTASGTTTAFIDTISQDANGKITVTKKGIGGTISANLIFSNSETSQAGQPTLTWKTVNSNTPYIGYASNQTDGTFVVASIQGTGYDTGLAIGGGSKNLLWKGQKVLVAGDANYYTLPVATSSARGGVKIGYSTSGKNYAVQLDDNERMYVNVPWTDTNTNTTYSAGTGLSLDGTEFNHSNSVTAKTAYGSTATTAKANGGSITVTDIKYDAQGHITGSTDRTITLSQDTYSLSGLGGVGSVSASGTAPLTLSASKSGTTVTLTGSVATAGADSLGVVQGWHRTSGTATGTRVTNASNAPAIAARTTTSGRYYGVETDASGRMFVNIPWTDTTYTALKNPNALTLQLNGTTNITYDGSSAQTFNIPVVTTSDIGLMSVTDKIKLDNTNIAYAICETAADIAEKVVTLSGNTQWALTTGSLIMIKFTVSNTASNVTLNVNNTGAYPIWYNNAEYTSTGNAYTGYANRTTTYMFNGTHYVWISNSYDANTQSNTNSTDTSSKIFLVGATSQGSNKTTYSHGEVYVGTDHHVYSNSKQVVNLSDTQELTNKTYNGYALAAACAKDVTDSSSASAIGTGTSLPTERDIYYGLPTINNTHNYTSSTTIYAPTTGGTANYVLIGQGATSTPTWTAQSNLSVGSATKATQDGSGNTITDTYMTKVNPTGTGSFSLNRKANTTIGNYSVATGYNSTASGDYSHAEGRETTASGTWSHAEGYGCVAEGNNSHAEGSYTEATGLTSHAEGEECIAGGSYSHAEGEYTESVGIGSHTEGYATIAQSRYQHVQGRLNIADSDNLYAHIVGNGTDSIITGNSSDPLVRSNAYTLDWNGNGWYAGTLTATAVYGAVWNDYAEYRQQAEKIEPGYCVASTDNGTVYKTTEKFQACDGIVSDTFGFAIGETEKSKTPLAVAGRVLAYCEGNRYDYHAGDTVCAGPGGKVVKMTREEIKEYPDRIIGIVSEIPEYDTWGTGNVSVNGRIWIKVK